MTGPSSHSLAHPSSHPAFVRYPAQAAFGRTLPKSKLYAHSHAGTRLKNLFVQQVEQIVWQFKLAPETINLPARQAVPEIQVFGIQLKTADFSLDVLRCIDQAVPFPIIFELTHAGRVQVAACYKRPAIATSDVATGRWVLSDDYFTTGWLATGATRTALLLALHLGGLYEQLLRALMPVPARLHETVAEQVARLGKIAAKQREVEKAAAQLAQETQFNRKVAINARLRDLTNELQGLSL